MESRFRRWAILATLLLVLAIAAGVATSLSPWGAIALVGGLSLVTLGVVFGGSSDLLFVAAFVAFSAGLLDAPGHFALGSLTLSALISLTCLALGLLLWLYRPVVPRDKGMRLFALFLGWALFVSLLTGIQIQGAQNLVVLAVFLTLAVVTSARVMTSATLAHRIWVLVKLAAIPAVGLYWLTLLQGGFGSSGLVSARAFALYALVPLSVSLADGRYGSRSGKVLALVLVLTIGASLSRTALVAAVVITLLAWTRPTGLRGAARTASLILVAGAVLFSAVRLFSPLQERFTTGDNAQIAGGIAINTSGRQEIWRVVWASYLESPIIGQGAGSSEVLLARSILNGDHPHNDYLRVLHDYGVAGLTILLAGLVTLIAGRWKAWENSLLSNHEAGPFHLGALLMLVAFAVTMLTDNTMVYTDVVGPLGLMVGVSIGVAASGVVLQKLKSQPTATAVANLASARRLTQ